MAQTGYSVLSLYYSTTASTAPTAGNLVAGELAINTNDGVLYYKDSSGVVQSIASKAGNSGSFTNLAYTGTFTGGTGIVNLGSGQFYKDASGNVGINTTSPASKLHVVGDIQIPAGNSLKYSSSAYITPEDNSIGARISGTAAITMWTGSTERMRIDSSGNVNINRTTPIGAGKLNLNFAGNVGQGLAINDSTSSNGAQFEAFYYGSGTFLGSISNVSNTAVAYNTTSDYRLKENIAPMTDALATVVALKPVTYKWKINGSDGQGFIAHELAEVMPECVTGEKDEVDAEGKPRYQGIDTSFLVATLTAAIQELNAKVTALEAQLSKPAV